jgi:regulation of enolase protein 1 (concanavalin A-like superfamily)
MGDGEIRAQVTSQTNTNANAMAGVMIRNDSTAGSANALVALTPSNGFVFQTRGSAGGNTTQGGTASSNAAPNNWVRLTKSGTLVTAYVSANGTSWTQIGTATLTTNSSMNVGLVVSSASSSALGTATFSNVSVTPFPGPWQTFDLGSTGLQGSAEYYKGAYTVKGAGTVSGTSDSFRYVYQTLSGDGQLTARISAPQNTGTSALLGVMIRDQLTPAAMYACMGVDGTGAYNFQYRGSTGGATSVVPAGSSGTAPNIWVQVVRSGNTLTGYLSADGVNWTQVTTQTITMGTNIYLGLVNASGSTTTLNSSVFDSLSVTP